MIKTPAIKKEYNGRIVLDIPELQFEKGKIYALVGPNGAGKSTFAKNCGLAYQDQKPYIFRMSVKKNLMLVSKDESLANDLLKALEMEEFANARADKLSGGETARIALARSLMVKRDAIILDEPTAAMDMRGTRLAENIIKEYSKTGSTIILITHSISQAKRLSDEILFLKDGKLNYSEEELKQFINFNF